MKHYLTLAQYRSLGKKTRSILLAATAQRLALEYENFVRRELHGSVGNYLHTLDVLWRHHLGSVASDETLDQLYQRFTYYSDAADALRAEASCDGRSASVALYDAIMSCAEHFKSNWKGVHLEHSYGSGLFDFLPEAVMDEILGSQPWTNERIDRVRALSRQSASPIDWVEYSNLRKIRFERFQREVTSIDG
ncbi:MAG: hypothetical protein WD768_09570 [Phycisphaeraceae bacterium]